MVIRATFSPTGIPPYLTETDPSLSRSAGGRDPLGLLPIWSAFGRQLVPYLATPVQQVRGVKAVLLIQWLAEDDTIAAVIEKGANLRGYYRLLEGLIEYWLHSHDLAPCFGSQALAVQKEEFSVPVNHSGMVVNGLYQYYRGTCRRAEFVSDDWKVDKAVAQELARAWPAARRRSLAAVLAIALGRGRPGLVPHDILRRYPGIEKGLAATFDEDFLLPTLQARLLGDERHHDIARQFLKLRSGRSELSARIHSLASDELEPALEDVRRCEPFLLVVQDIFDLLRAHPNAKRETVATSLAEVCPEMQRRAREFLLLGKDAPSGRLQRMLDLAGELAPQGTEHGASAHHCLIDFIAALVAYHRRCMEERGRDPLLLLEGETIVVPVANDRTVDDAMKRLKTGTPWMNDYYLNTAATICEQLYGAEV